MMFYISDQICMSTLTEIMRLNTTESSESPVPHKINVTFKCQYNDTYVASLEEIYLQSLCISHNNPVMSSSLQKTHTFKLSICFIF